MYRDQKISPTGTRTPHAILQRQIAISIANQHRFKALAATQSGGKFARDAKRDFLLLRFQVTDGPRVLTAMPGIDGNNDVAQISRFYRFVTLGCGQRLHTQINDQALAVSAAKLIGASANISRLAVDVQHDAQIVVIAFAVANTSDRASRTQLA